MSATVNSPEAIAQAALIVAVVLAAFFVLRGLLRAIGRAVTRRIAWHVDCALADYGTDDVDAARSREVPSSLSFEMHAADAIAMTTLTPAELARLTGGQQ